MVHALGKRGCTAILLSALLLLAGCDGGLFGTGSESIDDNGVGNAGPNDDLDVPGQEIDGAAGVGENPDSQGPDTTLENLLVVQSGPPTIDLLNLGESDRVDLVGGSERRVLASIGYREQLFDITLPPDIEPLLVISVQGDRVLADYRSVALADGSQTTLVVREPVNRAPAVVALSTRVEADDPTLALVRFIPSAGPTGAVTLAPRDESSGMASVSFAAQNYAFPDSEYVSIEPGPYTLRDASNPMFGGAVEIAAGQVVSLYTVGATDAIDVITVVDGDAPSSSYLDIASDRLRFDVLHEADGDRPLTDDTVTVDYTGRLLDGTLFDSSYVRGTPATFPLSGVIDGFRLGLLEMPVGSRYRFVIPPDLGYGAAGAPPAVPPDATLVFEVELLGIVP